MTPRRALTAALVIAALAAAAAAGYALGRHGGPSLARARADGARGGLAAGHAAAARDGYHAGFEAGRVTGYRAAFGPAYARSYASTKSRLVAVAAANARARARRRRAARIAKARARNRKPAPVPTHENRVERQLRACANDARAAAGLPLLRPDPVLDAAARFHARNMLDHDFFSHYDAIDGTPDQRVARFNGGRDYYGVGENIAAGQVSARQTCDDWMGSPGHRANILDPRVRLIGTGWAHGSTGYFDYYVQEFAIAAR